MKKQPKEVNFSRVFPAYHPRKGQETYFAEAILTQLGIDYTKSNYFKWLVKTNPEISESFLKIFFHSLSRNIYPKSHTIRNHKQPVKVGDFIRPKVWAGKPYHKTPEGYWKIQFAPDIEIKKVWNFEIDLCGIYSIDGEYLLGFLNGDPETILAKNDGLSQEDMFNWFVPNYDKPKEFKGKILCWNDKTVY